MVDARDLKSRVLVTCGFESRCSYHNNRLVMLLLHFTVANGDSRCGVRLAQLAQGPLIREPGSGFEVPKLYCSNSVTSLTAPSSSGLGHSPFTGKITGSNPVGVTNCHKYRDPQ